MLEDYSVNLYDFDLAQKLFEDGLEKCYTDVYRFRTNGLCLRCSGVADSFWDPKLGVYKIKKDNCRRLSNSCFQVFSFMAEAQTFFKRLSQIKKWAGGKLTEEDKVKGFDYRSLVNFRSCIVDRKKCDELFICNLFSLNRINHEIEGNHSVI